MDLILHIGHGKTGTTSIQKDLSSNSQLLLKSGILYHARRSHFNLIHGIGGNTRAPQLEHDNLKSKALDSLKEIGELALKHKVKFVLISAENLFGISRKKQKALLQSFGVNFNSIKVVAYIRRPADYYLSLMQQKVKADHNIINPIQFQRDFHRSLKRWYSLVGRDNFSLQAFDKRTLVNGDAVIDFYKRLEYLTDQSLRHIPHENTVKNLSLSAEQMIFMQAYRKDILPDYSGHHHPKSNNILSFFRKTQVLLSNNITMTKPLLKKHLDMMISNNHRAIIQNLDKLFETNFSKLFYSDLKSQPDDIYSDDSSYTNISQIVVSYNSQALEVLFQLMPEYNASLSGTSDDCSIPAVVLENPLLGLHYSRFLREHSMNCDSVSKYILERSLSKALELGDFDMAYVRSVVKDVIKYSDSLLAISFLKKAIHLKPQKEQIHKLLNKISQD